MLLIYILNLVKENEIFKNEFKIIHLEKREEGKKSKFLGESLKKGVTKNK